MIKKALIFIVLVGLCVYGLVGCGSISNSIPTRGPGGGTVNQQPPREYPDDNIDDDGDGNENTKP